MNKFVKSCLFFSIIGLSALSFGCLSPIVQEIVGKMISTLSIICLVFVGLFLVAKKGATSSKWYSVFLGAVGTGLALALVCSLIAALGHCYENFWLHINVWDELRIFYKENGIGIILAATFFILGSFAMAETLRAEFRDLYCESNDDTTDESEEAMREEEGF